jgi:hypothetical protein
LCTFVAQSVEVAQTILVSKMRRDKRPVLIPCGTRVEVSDWKNEKTIMFVHIHDAFPYTANLFPTTRTRRTPNFAQVTSLEKAHLALRSDGHEIILEPRTSTMRQCLLKTRYSPNGNLAHLPDAMDGIAHFIYFLDHSNEANTLKGMFTLEIHRLMGEYPHRKPELCDGQDGSWNQDGAVKLTSDEDVKYGFTIRNVFTEDLFLYLLIFDPETYTIQVSSTINIPGCPSSC